MAIYNSDVLLSVPRDCCPDLTYAVCGFSGFEATRGCTLQ